MDKIVFREYMKSKIIQKCVIFASAFGLKIDRWSTAKENGNNPYRIYFYQGNNIVGQIDAKAEIYGDYTFVDSEFPLILFSPIGNIKGYYSSPRDAFEYDLEIVNNTFNCIEGIFTVEYPETYVDNEKYIVRSHMTIKKDDTAVLDIGLNEEHGNVLYLINFDVYEELSCFLEDRLNIKHFYYPELSRVTLADITLAKEENESISAKCNFEDIDEYIKMIELYNESSTYMPFWRLFGLLDLSSLIEEIEKHDQKMYDLFNKVKNMLTFATSDGKQISLYDKMANLCFEKGNKISMLILSKTNYEKIDIENNPVIKKLENNRPHKD